MLADSNIFWWSGMRKDNDNKCNTCTACTSSGKKIKYQIPSTGIIKLLVLTKPGQQLQTDFSGKLHSQHVTSVAYILIRISQYSKYPAVRVWTSTETKEITIFLKGFINFYRFSDGTKSDGGSAAISEEYKEFCKNKNIEIEYSPPRLHTGMAVVECAIQTPKDLIIANLGDKMGFTKSINRVMRVMRFTIHTGVKVSPFE